MPLIFRKKSFDDECNSITDIIYEEQYGRIQNYLSQCFKLDLDYLYKAGKQEGYNIISLILKQEYEESKAEIEKKITLITTKWKEVSDDVLNTIEDILKYKIDKEKSMTAEFTINAVCPRYLDTWSFDVNYRKSNEEIILTCIHEIIHFIWFEKWTEVFPYADKAEFNAPALPWLLSEIVIDAILSETELKKYCVVDKPAYKYFYDIHIDGKNMMEYFKELFIHNDIKTFMKKGLEFVVTNKEIIHNTM